MNARKRRLAKRRRRLTLFRDHYNRPWIYNQHQSPGFLRWDARKALQSMGETV